MAKKPSSPVNGKDRTSLFRDALLGDSKAEKELTEQFPRLKRALSAVDKSIDLKNRRSPDARAEARRGAEAVMKYGMGLPKQEVEHSGSAILVVKGR